MAARCVVVVVTVGSSVFARVDQVVLPRKVGGSTKCAWSRVLAGG